MLGIFHWTPEGSELSTGFNIYWTKGTEGCWWFRIIWCWCNPQGDCATYYFRFRSWMVPHFIFRISSWNCIPNWLALNKVTLISDESYQDVCSIIKGHYFSEECGETVGQQYIDEYFKPITLVRKEIKGTYGPYKIFEWETKKEGSQSSP